MKSDDRKAGGGSARTAKAEAQAKKAATKQAKANRGFVKTAPAVGIALLAAGLAVFGIFFMNPLLESAAEAGLEAAFRGRADVEGLRFRPFRMSLSVTAVSVADAKAPMTDLFRTGRLEFRLDPAAVLRGKIYIEEASASSIILGAPRKTSGALPDAPPSEQRRKRAEPRLPALMDWAAFDAKALLDQEQAKLAAPAAYEAAGAAYAEAVERWKERRDSSKAAVEKARISARAALAIDPKAVRTAEQASRALALVKAAASDAKAVGSEAKAVAEGVRSDSAALDRLSWEARDAADRDGAYLRSLVTPGSGAVRAALEPSVRAVLSDKAEAWLYYGGRLMEAAARLRGGADERKTAEPHPRGRDVVFPGAAFPRFRLGLLASSFEADGTAWAVELRELSTEPDLVPSPSSLRVEARGPGGSRILVSARADLRESAGGKWDASASADGLPLDLKDALSGAGLDGFTGLGEGRAELRGGKAGGFEAILDGAVRDPAVAAPSGTLGKAAAEALRDAESVAVHAEYRAVPGSGDSFTLRTDLDEVLREAVETAARDYSARAVRQLDAALDAYVAEKLEGKLSSKKDFEALAEGAGDDEVSASSLEKSLEAKRVALEARAKDLGADVLKSVTIPKIVP